MAHYFLRNRHGRTGRTMVDFKGVHFPQNAILHAVFFYLRYAVSYRDLEEIMEERGVAVDHGTLNRWVVKFAPLIAAQAQSRKKPTAVSWRMDETYIKVKGKWTYYYRRSTTREKSSTSCPLHVETWRRPSVFQAGNMHKWHAQSSRHRQERR